MKRSGRSRIDRTANWFLTLKSFDRGPFNIGWWVLPAGWTLLLALSLWWNIDHLRITIQDLALVAARSSFQKDILFRQWASNHGGVYVPVTEQTPPNPYLSNIPERDIVTPSGRLLTLMNPAYMTRQLYELGQQIDQHSGHITSLNPIRPANAPDDWERQALEAFEYGAAEVSTIADIKGESHLRLMRPLITLDSCLKCHAAQGYTVGDIRGGISVAVPMREYEAIVIPYQRNALLIHGGVWVVGLGLIVAGTVQIQRRQRERAQAEAALRELNATLERRVAERTAELQTANLRLTELDHLKDEFLSRISHELRTPLTSVKIYIELLETGKPEKRDNYVQTLKREANRLQALIEEVLMFSQLNLYTAPSRLDSLDLNNLIAGRLTTWHPLSAGHGLQFRLDLARDLPRIRTDGELIMQALSRLITNAVNYTSAGSVTVSTACVNDGSQHWVTVSVRDTGPGIAPGDLPHIFERFYRGRAAADYKTPGVGIGLSISREIAEKLGGRLTVETEVGVGSTFVIWLPAAQAVSSDVIFT